MLMSPKGERKSYSNFTISDFTLIYIHINIIREHVIKKRTSFIEIDVLGTHESVCFLCLRKAAEPRYDKHFSFTLILKERELLFRKKIYTCTFLYLTFI